MWTSNITDTALIFEGGGMRAASSSGVVVALLENELFFDWVAGISAGSSCTINYLLRDPIRAKRSFVDIACDKRFASWGSFLRGDGYFNSNWIYRQTSQPDEELPFAFDRWLANPARADICALDADSGETVHWGRADLDSVSNISVRVQASSTMPVLMPVVHIDGRVFVDGALGESGGISLAAAQTAGFEKFLIVRTRERGYRKTPSRLPGWVKPFLRDYPAVVEAMATRWARFNKTVDEIDELERSGAAYVFYPDSMTISNATIDYEKLLTTFHRGLDQARREALRIKEFLEIT